MAGETGENGDKSIGPVYKWLGFTLGAGTLFLTGLAMILGYKLIIAGKAINLSRNHMILIGVLLLSPLWGALLLLRPKWLDRIVRTIADKLPFISYKKTESSSTTTPETTDEGGEK